MYATDSTLFRYINSFDDEIKLQDDLTNIILWSHNNGIKLNAIKCKFMDITLSSLRRFGKYYINGVAVVHANCIKMLGVYIPFNLPWNYHADHIRAKAAKLLWFVIRNLRIVHQKLNVKPFRRSYVQL
jgi:hypothetical protein